LFLELDAIVNHRVRGYADTSIFLQGFYNERKIEIRRDYIRLIMKDRIVGYRETVRTEKFLRLGLVQSDGKCVSIRSCVRDFQEVEQNGDIAFPDTPAKNTFA
jgi:hypothetical protein